MHSQSISVIHPFQQRCVLLSSKGTERKHSGSPIAGAEAAPVSLNSWPPLPCRQSLPPGTAAPLLPAYMVSRASPTLFLGVCNGARNFITPPHTYHLRAIMCTFMRMALAHGRGHSVRCVGWHLPHAGHGSLRGLLRGAATTVRNAVTAADHIATGWRMGPLNRCSGARAPLLQLKK